MKIYFVLPLVLVLSLQMMAQVTDKDTEIIFSDQPSTMQFGDFLIDLNLLSPKSIPHFSEMMLPLDATQSYYKQFELPLQWTLNNEPVVMRHTNSLTNMGIFSHTTELQSATFRLGKNSQITTYGQYTLDGRRIPDRSTPPWERKDFMGGMEVKFNKNFGIRVEVQQRRGSMYGPW